MPERTCGLCSAAFMPKRKDSRFCSRTCAKRAGRDNLARQCATVGCEGPTRAKGLCAKHYKAQHPNRRAWKKNGNPEVRRASLRTKTQMRRARTKGDANPESINRDSIGERDGWRCGLCHLRVNRRLPYPNPRSASLDHIVPLSQGGKHVLANVQITHLACNVAKSNHGGGEQLLLIG